MGPRSAECCSVPPIISKGYQAKGTYETINGIKTYVTGPPTATIAILYIFDIFGYFPQSLQGADILSTSSDHEKFLVFMPDFFDGNAADISWYPPDNEEKGKKLGNFFETTGAPRTSADKIPGLVKAFGEKYTGVKKFGIVGFCWGGKVVSLSLSAPDQPFAAAAQCHPAFIDPADAEKIRIPHALLASKDESAEDVKKFEANLKTQHLVETFSDQIHGWMAARSDLEDSRVKEEYERGYKILIDFFMTHLTGKPAMSHVH